MRISDWSSDVCSSDLAAQLNQQTQRHATVIFPYCRPETARNPLLMAPSTHAPIAAIATAPGRDGLEIGRASCRDRVCKYVSISVVGVSIQKKTIENYLMTDTYKQKQQLQKKKR